MHGPRCAVVTVVGLTSLMAACANDDLDDLAASSIASGAATQQADEPGVWLKAASETLGEPVVATPIGVLPARCVMEVGATDVVDFDGKLVRHASGTTSQLPACDSVRPLAIGGAPSAQTDVTPPATNGWVENANILFGFDIRKLSVPSFSVPIPPARNVGQLIYLFPAMEPSNGGAILQPVLQWGSNGAFGGAFWSLASWTIVNGVAAHSVPLLPAVHDSLQGVIHGESCSTGCDWWVDSQDRTRGTITTARVAASRNFRWIFGGALEVYGATTCDTYPGDVTFDSIGIWDFGGVRRTPKWNGDIVINTGCNQVIHTDSNSVALHY